MTDIDKTRICVQQILPHHTSELQNKNVRPQQQQKLAAAFWAKKIWPPGSVIRIAFLEDGNNIEKVTTKELISKYGKGEPPDPLQDQINSQTVQELVRKIVRERIKPLTNLDIDFVDDPTQANVRISFDPTKGAWSYVGTDHLEVTNHTLPTMNFGWFDVPTCIHEFGHMLGMIHEHQNPRGKTIQWDTEKVVNWAKQTQNWSREKTITNIIKKYDVSTINGSNFDPCSIMLYFFPGSLTLDNVGSNQNLRLSATDVKWISKVYNNNKSPAILYNNFYNQSFDENIKKCDIKAGYFNGDNESSDNQSGESSSKNIYNGIRNVLLIITIICFVIFLVYKNIK